MTVSTLSRLNLCTGLTVVSMLILSGCGNREKDEEISSLKRKLAEKEKIIQLMNKADAMMLAIGKTKDNCPDTSQRPELKMNFTCAQAVYTKLAVRLIKNQDQAAVWGMVATLNNTYRAIQKKNFDSRFKALGDAMEDSEFRSNADPIKVVNFIRRSATLSEQTYLKTIADTNVGLTTELSRANAGNQKSKAGIKNNKPTNTLNSKLEIERATLGITPEVRKEYCESGALPLTIPNYPEPEMKRLMGCSSGIGSSSGPSYSLNSQTKIRTIQACKEFARQSSLSGDINWSGFGTGDPQWWNHSKDKSTLILTGEAKNAFNKNVKFNIECGRDGDSVNLVEITYP